MSRRRGGLLSIALACAAPGCGGPPADLFDGPFEIVQPERRPAYRAAAYDLSAYGRPVEAKPAFTGMSSEREGTAGPTWVDGEAREVLRAAMAAAAGESRPHAALDLVSPSVYRETPPSRVLALTYPPRGAVFPPNLAPPRIDWQDEANDAWQVSLGIGDGPAEWTQVTTDRQWRLAPPVWEAIRQRAVEAAAWVQVKGVRRTEDGWSPAVQATPRVRFRVSRWPADEAIVYRLVTPPFNMRKTPSTYTRRVGSFEVQPFLLARDQYCYNCHTFSSKSGASGKIGVQVRYMARGADLPVYLGIYDLEARQGWKARLPFDVQMSTFMSWSPDGRWLAFSANQQLVTLSPVVYETQHAGEPTSDVAIYDTRRNEAYLLAGADSEDRLELLPRFSADGRRIVFCSAPVGEHPALVRYDLHEIPFDGGAPAAARPVPGAAANGRSNYFPRFSPDGRWLSFCQSDGGLLMKSSSDIHLMPADLSAPPTRLASNADHAADSWHSWSSNSRWIVFASKRDDGIFARLYMTRIDDEGRASPAVRLPVEEEPLRSFNIPEFLARPPRVSEAELFEAVRVEQEARTVDLGR